MACFFAGLGTCWSSSSAGGAGLFLGDFGTLGGANAAEPRKTGGFFGEVEGGGLELEVAEPAFSGELREFNLEGTLKVNGVGAVVLVEGLFGD